MKQTININTLETKTIGLMAGLLLMIICLPWQVFAQKTKPKPKPKPKTPTQTVAKSSPADKLLDEGFALFKQATVQSYQAALPKFSQAAELYAQKNDAESQADCYIMMGRTYNSLLKYDQAFENYKTAIEIYERINFLPGQAIAWNNIGIIFRDNGRFQEGLQAYQTAVNLMRQTKNKDGEAKALNGLGECLFGLGKITEAKGYFTSAQGIQESLAASEDKVRTDYNLGKVYINMGDAKNGLEYFEQSLRNSRQYNNPILEGDILESMAQHYDANGNLTKAVELRQQIFTAYNNSKASTVTPYRVLMSLNSLIFTYFKAGDFQSCFVNLKEGIEYATRHNENYMLTYLQGNTGSILYEQGKYEESIPYLNKGITLAKQTENKYIESFYLAVLGLVYLEKEDFNQAENYLIQAKQVMPLGKESASSQGKVLAALIKFYAEQGEKGKVNEYITEGRKLGLEAGISQGSVIFLSAIAYSQLKAEKTKEAVQTFNQAFALATKIGHEVEKAKILYEASNAYLQSGDAQSAIQMAQTSHDFFKKLGNDQMDMKTHLTMGEGLMKLGQGQQAIANYNSALDFAQKYNDQMSQILSLTGIASVYERSNDFKSSIQYLNQALSVAQQTNVGEVQKFILDVLGNNYEKSGDKKKAKEFRDKAKKIKD